MRLTPTETWKGVRLDQPIDVLVAGGDASWNSECDVNNSALSVGAEVVVFGDRIDDPRPLGLSQPVLNGCGGICTRMLDTEGTAVVVDSTGATWDADQDRSRESEPRELVNVSWSQIPEDGPDPLPVAVPEVLGWRRFVRWTRDAVRDSVTETEARAAADPTGTPHGSAARPQR